MPKAKIKRKSTVVDMTAMCDVAFLLLTFFMLTSNFVKKEPVLVSTPSSVSEIKIPETNVMTILIDKTGKVYFGIDGQENRQLLIEKMAETYKVNLTPEEIKCYTVLDLVGNPMQALKTYLSLKPEVRDLPQNNLGIPADSTNNEFKDWVKAAREINPDLRLAIKADETTPYPVIRKVMTSLQELDENRYNLITRLEGAPGKE
ncbi:MAG TPA: biopolymer transporter ExbD [Bacteroidales bacterium]|nr:biopolymer transporter ExbD [Bacteroidales bacterium]HPT01521.1 biopolymer transporter ExbD [Bacteroidales bacterium]